MITRLIKWNISKYTLISSIAGVVDISLAYYLYRVTELHYLLASNLGIAVGFIFQFIAGMKYVFIPRNYLESFIVYLVTLFLGVFIANGILWFSYSVIRLSFLISKFLSMVLPFFIIYSIRRVLLDVWAERGVK